MLMRTTCKKITIQKLNLQNCLAFSAQKLSLLSFCPLQDLSSTSSLDEQLSELESILSQLESSQAIEMSDFASTLNELQKEIKVR